MRKRVENAPEVVAYSVAAFCEAAAIGRTSLMKAINSGSLRAVRIGSRVVIPADAAREWLASLPPAAA